MLQLRTHASRKMTMDVGRIFPVVANSVFSRGRQKRFFRGDKSCEISLYPHETKKTTFFC